LLPDNQCCAVPDNQCWDLKRKNRARNLETNHEFWPRSLFSFFSTLVVPAVERAQHLLSRHAKKNVSILWATPVCVSNLRRASAAASRDEKFSEFTQVIGPWALTGLLTPHPTTNTRLGPTSHLCYPITNPRIGRTPDHLRIK
jgi:hypothetical protein